LLLLVDSHAAQYSIDIWKLSSEQGYEVYFGGDFGGPIDTSKVISLAKNIKPQKIIFSKYWRSESTDLSATVSETMIELKNYTNSMGIIGQNPIFQITDTHQNRATLISMARARKLDLGPHEKPIHDLDPGAVLGGKAVAKFANSRQINLIDPREVFCSAEKCQRWEKGNWLYIDNNHLSSKGAEKVKPLISRLIGS